MNRANHEVNRSVRRYVKEVRSMQRKRQITLVQVGGGLMALAILVYLLQFVTSLLVHIAGIAFAIGLVLLIVGLVLPNRGTGGDR